MKIGKIIFDNTYEVAIALDDPNAALIYRNDQVIGITNASKYAIVEHRVLNNTNTTDRDYYFKYGSSKEEDMDKIRFDVIKCFDTKDEAERYLNLKVFW
jgi:hypothetical protein